MTNNTVAQADPTTWPGTAVVTATALAATPGRVLHACTAGTHQVITSNTRTVGVMVTPGWYDTRRTDGVTASVRDHDTGQPFDRTVWGERLGMCADIRPAADEEGVRLTAGEAEAVASLLDEYAALFPGEDIGKLARILAVRIYDRAGV